MSDEAQAARPPDVNDGSDLMDGQWKPIVWNDIDGLRCAICEWDTLEGLDQARQHAAHCLRCARPIAQTASPTIPIMDRWGNIIEPTDGGQ